MKPGLWLLTTIAVASPLAHAQSAFDQTTPSYASSRPQTILDQAPTRNTVRSVPTTAPAYALTSAPTDLPLPGSVQNLAPQNLEMPKDGKCQGVRAGDLVHFTLKIQSAQDARGIFTDLQLANGHLSYKPNELPLPGGNVLGGGGVAMRDARDRDLYHFSFVVPDVMPGVYRTLGIAVRGDYGAGPGESIRPVGIPLDRHAVSEVRRYCLAVFGPGGVGHRPVVTEFKRGPVDRAAVLPPATLPSDLQQ